MCSLSSHHTIYVRSASIQINNLRDANRRFATGSLTYAAAAAAAGNFHRAHLHMMRVAYLRSLGRVNSLEDKSDAPSREMLLFSVVFAIGDFLSPRINAKWTLTHSLIQVLCKYGHLMGSAIRKGENYI
jgi:hypothetical protein